MLVQKLIIQAVAKILTKKFKLNKVLHNVEEPNELDKEVEQLKNRVDMLEIIIKKEK